MTMLRMYISRFRPGWALRSGTGVVRLGLELSVDPESWT